MGMVVHRGSLVVKIHSIKDDPCLTNLLGMTEREVKTALAHLRKTGEITTKASNKFTLINIVNYAFYQNVTDDSVRQASDKRPTNVRLTSDIVEEGEEEKNIDMSYDISLAGLRRRYTAEQLTVIDSFFDLLKHTRASGRLSKGVVLKAYQSWEKHEPQRVLYALHRYIHSPALHDKKENYVLGIIRNTTAADIERYKVQLAEAGAPRRNNRQPQQFKTAYERTLDTAKAAIEAYKNGEVKRIDI